MTSWAVSSYCRPGTEYRSRGFAVKSADAAAIRAKGALFAVVDGSISPALPDKAAETVGQSLLRFYYSSETGRDPQIALRLAVQRAVSTLDSLRPAGSAPLNVALAAGVVWQDELLLARVGDCAALLLRNGHAISLSPESPDFDAILESSLPLLSGDRVALCTAAAAPHLPAALDLQRDPTRAAFSFRNAAAADAAIAHAAIALLDHVAHSQTPAPPPQTAPAAPAAPPAPPPQTEPATPAAPPAPPPQTEPAAPAAPPAPPPQTEPATPASPPAPPPQTEPAAPAAPPAPPPQTEPATPASPPAAAPIDPVPPTMPHRRRKRFPVLLLVLLAALAGASAYFYVYPNNLALVRTQALAAAEVAAAAITRMIDAEPPLAFVPVASEPTIAPISAVESPLPMPSDTAESTSATLSATLTPAPSATPTPTLAPTSSPTPTATPEPTSTAEPTAIPTATSSPTPQPIGDVVREAPSATAVPTANPTTDDGRQTTAVPTAAPTAAPTAVPTTIPTTIAEEPLPEGEFPPLPTPPP